MSVGADFRADLIAMVRESCPELTYGHVYTYTVDAVRADGTLDLAPAPEMRDVLGELPAVEQWSLGGVTVTPQVGAEVCVIFRDARGDRPVVLPWAPAPRPARLTLGAGATGAFPLEHAASIEAVVNLLNQIVVQIGVQSPGPLTGAGLAATWIAIVNAALPFAGPPTGNIGPFAAALTAALAAKLPDPTGTAPGVGWPSVRGA